MAEIAMLLMFVLGRNYGVLDNDAARSSKIFEEEIDGVLQIVQRFVRVTFGMRDHIEVYIVSHEMWRPSDKCHPKSEQ